MKLIFEKSQAGRRGGELPRPLRKSRGPAGPIFLQLYSVRSHRHFESPAANSRDFSLSTNVMNEKGRVTPEYFSADPAASEAASFS